MNNNDFTTTTLFKRYKKFHGYNCRDVKLQKERKKILVDITPKILDYLLSKKRTSKNINEINHFIRVIENRPDIYPLLVGYGLKDTLIKYLDKVKSYIFFPKESLGRNSFKLFEEYKDVQISKIEVNREPVNKVIQTVLNLITFGGFEKAKKSLSYDDMFHLYIIVELSDGTKLKIEKNQKINIEKIKSYKMENEKMMIDIDRPLTLSSMFKTTIDKVGSYRFYIYSAFQNNCQRFIMDLLESNNLGNPEIYKYVLQDAGYILENNPSFLRKIAQFSTDTAAKLQELFGLGNPISLPISLQHTNTDTNTCNHNCGCIKCRYMRLKDKGYYISYDTINKNYKYKFKGEHVGVSNRMDRNSDNLEKCISEVETYL